jgi:hypothetical protein
MLRFEPSSASGLVIAANTATFVKKLFNSRKQSWHRHFCWDQTILLGKTKTGIVTVQVLNINDPARVMLRENLLFEGRFPPEE